MKAFPFIGKCLRGLNAYVHQKILQNVHGQNMETTEMPINKRIDTFITEQSYNGILHNNKKKKSTKYCTTTHNNKNKPFTLKVEQKKPEQVYNA